MTATIQREWMMGLPSGFQFVLRGLRGAESILNGTPMGRTQKEANDSLATINASRHAKGLESINA